MISTCPICSYSLSGLPDEHKCPECGFEYERDMFFIQQERLGLRLLAITNVALCVAVVVAWHLGRIGLIAVGPFAVLLVGSLFRLAAPRRGFIVSRRELQFVRNGRLDQRFPMAKIRGAEYSWIAGEVAVTAHDGTVPIRIPRGFLWSTKRAKSLAAAINDFASKQRSLEAPVNDQKGHDVTLR